MEKIKKILTNKWIIVCLLIPYIKPATELTGNWDIVFDIMKIINSILIIGSYAFIIKKPSKILISIFILQLVFMISTIINNGRIWWGVVQFVSIVSLCALLDLELNLDKKNALKGFSIALGVMAFATVCTMFIFHPNGMYIIDSEDLQGIWVMPESSNYLWGFDNASIFKFITTIVILVLNAEINNNIINKSLTLIMLLLISIAFIYVDSLTAYVVCLFLLIYYIFILISKKSFKILNFRNIFIINIILFSVLIIFNKNIKILQQIAINTDKVTSMDYRFQIWENTIEEFKRNWIIGYGHEDRVVTAQKLRIDHSHNIFLDIIYRGGTTSIIAYITLIVLIYIPMMKNKGTMVANIITIGLFSLFLVGQMDYYNDQYLLFLLYVLAYNVETLKEEGEKNE